MDIQRLEQYLRVAAIALLVFGCLLVLRPFIGAIILAGILCYSTWPAFVWLRGRWKGRSSLAALAFILVLLVAIALPVALAAQSLIVHSADAFDAIRRFLEEPSSLSVPAFVREIPLVGASLDEYGRRLLQSRDELIALVKQLSDPLRKLLVVAGSAVGEGLIQVLIAIFVAFFFYRDGDEVQQMLGTGVARLAGEEQGPILVATAQSAIKGVVYGLIGTAIVQALVALLGFLIAGVPGALLLSALTFVLSLVPLGPVLIWGGAAAWLQYQGETGWAIFMVLYGVFVISSVDNVVKPILMSRAGNLSMLLVVLGVFGGAVAFGFIGLFVGPALLAVAWNITKVWLNVQPKEPKAA